MPGAALEDYWHWQSYCAGWTKFSPAANLWGKLRNQAVFKRNLGRQFSLQLDIRPQQIFLTR